MIERGTAHINNGAGFIKAEQAPSPVGFLPASFRLVHDGDPVNFKRAPFDPNWAVSVAPDDSIAAMASGASWANMTAGAARHLTETIMQQVAHAQAAPTVEQTEHHLQLTGKKLKALFKAEASGPGKLDVRSIGKILKKI